MEKQFNFYNTGMHLATFAIDGQTVTVRPANTQAFSPLTAEQAEHYAARAHFDLQATLQTWAKQDFALPDPTTSDYEPVNAHYWIQRHARPALDLVVNDQQVVGFQMTAGNVTSILVESQAAQYTAWAEWQAADMVRHPQAFGEQFHTQVTMRDGIELATTVILPADRTKPVATIMERTPYDRHNFLAEFKAYVQRGYAIVVQDARGRSDSQGEWVPMKNERDDGDDTLNWIAAQPWSNGKVGMIGGSYGGFVQWAAASSGNPHLAALVSMVTAGGPFTDILYRMGVPLAGFVAWYFAVSEKHFTPERLQRDDWDSLLKVRPLTDIPVVGLGHALPGYNEIISHDHYDDYLADFDWQNRADQITVPALIQSGWYDDDGVGTTEALRVTDDYPQGQRKVILGPWLHGGNAQYDLGDITLPANAVRHDIDLIHLQWFDHFLNGVDNGIDQTAPVEYFTMNDNRWHEAERFEPDTPATTWYLDANDASFKTSSPTQAAQQSFDYDPEHPTPQLVDVSSNEFEFPNDYAAVEAGNDVTSFTSAPFQTPTTITGWFKVNFFASSSAVDTDWCVRLTDVTPDGKSLSIVDTVMNAKFREDWRTPLPLVPNTIYRYQLETQKTSYCFPKGHRLRLDICSSAANLTFPNSNTAEAYNSKVTVIAHQTIHTGAKTPSNISFHFDERIDQ